MDIVKNHNPADRSSIKTHSEDWIELEWAGRNGGTLQWLSLCREKDGVYLRPAFTMGKELILFGNGQTADEILKRMGD